MSLGKSPEAVFYNAEGEEVERIDISGMLRDELNELMINKGIKKKEASTDDEGSKHDEI